MNNQHRIIDAGLVRLHKLGGGEGIKKSEELLHPPSSPPPTRGKGGRGLLHPPSVAAPTCSTTFLQTRRERGGGSFYIYIYIFFM
jgi:hypothetical protein